MPITTPEADENRTHYPTPLRLGIGTLPSSTQHKDVEGGLVSIASRSLPQNGKVGPVGNTLKAGADITEKIRKIPKDYGQCIEVAGRRAPGTSARTRPCAHRLRHPRVNGGWW